MSAPLPGPTGAMSSTLCEASKKVSAQEKKEYAKPPTRSDWLWVTKSADGNQGLTHAHPHTQN